MRRSVERVANVAGQLAMIAVGAYLGLQAEQWREDRSKAALARTTLRNFRDEIAANRATLAQHRAYHQLIGARLDSSMRRHARDASPLPFDVYDRETRLNGTQPFEPQSTAYDLAVATQALGDLPAELAFRLARLYTYQRATAAEQAQLNQAVGNALPSPRGDASRLLMVLDDGMMSVRTREQALARGYDRALPALDSALAGR